MKRVNSLWILLCLFYLQIKVGAQTQSMTISGSDWIPVHNLTTIAEAGSDLPEIAESVSNQHYMNVEYTVKLLGLLGLSARPFRIEVRKSDINWESSLSPSVRRTGGTPDNSLLDILSNPSSISGGTNYQNITDISTTLFTGYGKVDNISLQYRISGVSLTLPAEDYETEIIYTMWDND